MSKIDLYKGEYLEEHNKIKKELIKQYQMLIDAKNRRVDNLIDEALCFVYGKNYSIEDMIERGYMVYNSHVSRQFVMDGKVLLEFHELQSTEIFYRLYKKVKNDFNKCLPSEQIIQSEVL